MLQTEIAPKNLSMVGEEISQDLAAKMIKDFYDMNPNDVVSNYIGRNILERILAQPNCVGIRFYNGINETGKKNLVYVGIDANNQVISRYTGVNTVGALVHEEGIIGDRSSTEDGWGW